ncbi:hypothetical protein [Paraflavitalea speifideaquila]|uniref:hypothetical protein n=1 Tax=Paraflavitalea speifideaquila TaxID=3076558 RepID=UPI0028E5712E|nr:hypothetical protein [Paraflavitalea speifideiaquila]
MDDQLPGRKMKQAIAKWHGLMDGRFLGLRIPFHHRFDPGYQFFFINRFGNVIIAAQVKALELINF